MGAIRKFIDANVKVSKLLDSVLPAGLREDGNKFYIREYLPTVLIPSTTVYDVGGGSRPCVSCADKQRLSLYVVGLDVSAEELAAAPQRVYDRTIAADLCTFKGNGDADAVVCQALFEHVPDAPGAIRALASIVRPGGLICIFAPGRNAIFARLNLLLPQAAKRRLLFKIFPGKAQGHDGFKAYYDHCTPRQIEALARAAGLEVERKNLFWTSSYFSFFVPAFIAWRVAQGLTYLFIGVDAAESFAYIFRRPAACVTETT